jgi:hypothetical protein
MPQLSLIALAMEAVSTFKTSVYFNETIQGVVSQKDIN